MGFGGFGSRVVRETELIFEPIENKGFTEESRAKVGLDTISTSTPLEADKSHCDKLSDPVKML
jgi:hypothetical protein